MTRNFTLSVILSACSLLFCKFSNATTYVDNGTSNTYALNAGDSLYIASGTYTGIISSFASGAKITVSDAAIFQPSSMSFPNVRGTMYVYGTFTMNTQLRTNSGFTLNNYGVVSVNSTTLMSGSGQVWTNYGGALMDLVGDVSMTNDNKIINYSTINCGANLTMTGTSQITNYKNINVIGNYLNSGGTFTNHGKFETTGSITFNNGLAIINNYCRMISSGGINNTSGVVNNYSYIWAKDNLGLGNIVNSGLITNGPGAIIHSKNFNNTGTVNGSGYLYFTGFTTTTNLGTTGVSGATTDTIKMYDITRTSPATIYDDQRGIVHPNVIYSVFTAPDSTRIYVGTGCSVEILLEAPLAIEWNYFSVNLSDNIPVLTWSADYDPGTVFEIQRSYDGTSFYAVKDLPSEYGQSEYNFSDRQVNTMSPAVYYRIKATELSGEKKYTATRLIRFSNKADVIIHTAPNPFTSNFNINYNATGNEMITVRMFNISGQQKFAKNITVNSGVNVIKIAEAEQFAEGIYIIQVSRGNNLITSTKIIKQ